ncbi:MAG: DPP IV N-terminal domain-containing protein, partial [Verrucomicrobiota bacterium]
MNRLAVFLLPLALVTPTFGGGSKGDYERADQFRSLFRGKVRNERVSPNWTGEGSEFWYRSKDADGSDRLFLVDPEKGTKVPIEKPPVNSSANGTTVPILPSLRGAERQGPETSIRFINRTDEPLSLLWVSRPDNLKSYGKVDPGTERSQHTYTGHVWAVRNEEGKTLGIFEAIDGEGVAIIDGSKPTPTKARKHEQPRHRFEDHLERRFRGPKSPDGKWQAAIENHRLVVTHLQSGETHLVSDGGTEADPFAPPFHWSKDSSRLVVMQTESAPKRTISIVQSSPEDQVQPKLIEHTYNKPGDPLPRPRPRLFDVPAGREIEIDNELFPNPWSLRHLLWAPDSKRFTFLYNERGHQVLRLVAIDATTGEASTLIEETPDTFVCYSSKSFYAPIEETGEIIWGSERDGWYHLYLF